MNFPPQLQEKIEKWASSQGISTEQFILQAITEKIAVLSQHETEEDTQLNLNQANIYRKNGILVVEAELPVDFDINTFIDELREERIQDQIEELLIAGLESGETIEVNDEWWEQKRTHLMN